MSRARIVAFTTLALIGFAGNSLLCRIALTTGGTDPASFTAIRLGSGAVALLLVASFRGRARRTPGDWWSATALFAYAAGFSFAYVVLPTGTGALLLFGAVQATMIGYGVWSGERLGPRQIAGCALAVCGLVGLLFPGLTAPSPSGSLFMLAAGVAWGVYSLRGRGAMSATGVSAGNFLRSVPLALFVSALTWPRTSIDATGLLCAVASGAIASGLGYALWYAALPHLRAISAATVQLSVPVLAAAGGIAFLGEILTLRLVVSSVALLGGIGLVVLSRRRVVADVETGREIQKGHARGTRERREER